MHWPVCPRRVTNGKNKKKFVHAVCWALMVLHYRLVDLHWMRSDLFIHSYYTFLDSASARCTDLLVHTGCWAALDNASQPCTDRQLSWLTELGRSNRDQPGNKHIVNIKKFFFHMTHFLEEFVSSRMRGLIKNSWIPVVLGLPYVVWEWADSLTSLNK
jgi:hypothetical protein